MILFPVHSTIFCSNVHPFNVLCFSRISIFRFIHFLLSCLAFVAQRCFFFLLTFLNHTLRGICLCAIWKKNTSLMDDFCHKRRVPFNNVWMKETHIVQALEFETNPQKWKEVREKQASCFCFLLRCLFLFAFSVRSSSACPAAFQTV